MTTTQKILLVASLLVMPALATLAKNVPLNNKNIYVGGAPYVIRTAEKLFYKRFPDDVLALPDSVRQFSAKTGSSTSGIVIGLRAKTGKLHLNFSPEPGFAEKGTFLILRNGAEYRKVNFTNQEATTGLKINLDSLAADKAYNYEIVLPSYANFSLTGLEIDDHSELLPYNSNKKIYIGFGDSITHGRGQDGATYLTYPYQVAQKLNMELFNQAIGGAKVSVPLAEKAGKLPQADVITILIGYNDLNGGSHSAERFEQDYRQFVSLVRKNQPKAKIFCINLLYTKKKENAKTHLTPDDFRGVIKKVVGEYQKHDKKLYLIEGENITSLANLQPGEKTDPVHLTVQGAALFADALYNEMKKNL